MSIRKFNIFMITIYLIGFIAVIYFVLHGWSYYMLPIKEKPHSDLHLFLKPGGLWGHGFGIIGSLMILLLFIYSARKRHLLGFRWGKIRNWLNMHIFLGVMGPLLITLHTAGKLQGLVAISYFSMLAVIVSGVFGRYIYIQIPRDETGHELALDQIDERNEKFNMMLSEQYKLPDIVIYKINSMSRVKIAAHKKGLSALLAILKDDLSRPFRFRRLRKYLRNTYPDLPLRSSRLIIMYSKKKTLLIRQRMFLDTVNSAFHYWHVIHKPFAWTMIFIMFIHIGVVILMGYRWIL